MPVYGTEKTVVRAIESVRSQTDEDFELIIVNDQSPDNSKKVILDHLSTSPDYRIRYIENDKNIGLALSRNHGMDEARGEWIAFLDSDDAYQPNFLEIMHKNTLDADLVVAAHDVAYQDGAHRYRQYTSPGVYDKYRAQKMALQFKLTPFAWDKLFRSSTVGSLRFPAINRVEDAGFSIPFMGQVKQIRVIPDSLYLYSVNPQSITWGSVPPISETYKFMSHIKETTCAHNGSEAQKNAFAVTWVVNWLNSAQSALRLQPANSTMHIKQCRDAMKFSTLLRCFISRPVIGSAGLLFKFTPVLYNLIYKTYVRYSYGL